MKAKRSLRVLVVGLFALVGGLSAPAAFAASQDECAIWICLPGGFPSGCGAAHSAMMDRIKDRKSPLPSFSSCAVEEEGDNMTYTQGVAAYVPERRVCSRWGGKDSDFCIGGWVTKPAHYVRGTSCRRYDDHGPRHPEGCSSTKRYIDVRGNGVMYGDSYYW